MSKHRDGNLVLSRAVGESVYIWVGKVRVTVTRVKNDKLSFTAPKKVKIMRSELLSGKAI